MRRVITHAPGDVHVVHLRIGPLAYRGAENIDHVPMGHEYVGLVTAIGDEVATVEVGDFAVARWPHALRRRRPSAWRRRAGAPVPARADPARLEPRAMDERRATKVLLTV